MNNTNQFSNYNNSREAKSILNDDNPADDELRLTANVGEAIEQLIQCLDYTESLLEIMPRDEAREKTLAVPTVEHKILRYHGQITGITERLGEVNRKLRNL